MPDLPVPRRVSGQFLPNELGNYKKMRNIKLTLEYDGTRYSGWQIQTRVKGRPTIQGEIEKALRKTLQEKITVIGASRTDAGVHAEAQVAHFKAHSALPLKNIQRALNSRLPHDIVVTRAEVAAPDFHAQRSAKSKIYRYVILNRNYPSALLRHKVLWYRGRLNVGAMRKEAKALLGKHDFTAFQGANRIARSSVRTIKNIAVAKKKDQIEILIEANGFLYNMVRNIVGTLIEIGRGKFPAGSMRRILASRERIQAGPTAPACGLTLVKVRY